MFRRWLNPLQLIWLVALMVLPAAALTGVSLDIRRAPRNAGMLDQTNSNSAISVNSPSGPLLQFVSQETGWPSSGCE